MASIFSTMVTIDAKNKGGHIDGVDHTGAYLIIVKCDNPSGTHAIFHLAASAEGQCRIKKTVSVPGADGEQLQILWPDESRPMLVYEDLLPLKPQSYNLKII